MDYSRILRRAWEITWRYRALWLFGILAAIFAGGGGGGNSGTSYSGGGRFPSWAPSAPFDMERFWAAIVIVVLALILLAIVLAIAGVFVRYISETAVIRMVDDYETTGIKRRIRDGFRLGWSRAAWRLFLIDLVIAIPVGLAFVLLFLLSFSPLLLWVTGVKALGVLGTVATVGLILLMIVLAILAAAAISLLKPFFWRMAALQGRGVFDSIGEGYRMVRRHLREAGSMWLILIGIGIAFGLAMIPVVIIIVIVSAVVAALLALAVVLLAGLLVSSGAAPWIAGAIVGVPVFFVLLVVPLSFVQGLWLIYKSSVWTLTFRELRALEGVPPALPPVAAEG